LTDRSTKRLSTKRLQQLIKNLEIEISSFFTAEEIEQLAKQSKFVQRENAVKVDGRIFLDLIVFNSDQLKQQSLNDLAVALNCKYGIDITKQSLNERFNQYALVFLKNALEKLLQNQVSLNRLAVASEHFNRILIKDSVCFQIDESLKDLYEGSGGSGSDAAVRIQFEYDVLNGVVNDLSVNAFNHQDATDSLATIEKTQTGDLVIRDLAYMNLEVLKRLIEKLVIFICRVNPTTKIYELIKGNYEELNFDNIKRYMIKHQLSCLEKQVYLSLRYKLKVRLMIYLLPDEVVNERLRKAQRNNNKKGRSQISKEYRARAHFNLFITNGAKDVIPIDKVYLFYKLRWQIELMFKIWKSLCNIDKVKKVKRHRLECYIYSRLIFIVFAWQIIWIIATALFAIDNKPLSYYKTYKTLIRNKLNELREIFLSGVINMNSFLIDLYELSKAKHILEKKKNTLTSVQIMLTCIIT
jgi:hypothetical protein